MGPSQIYQNTKESSGTEPSQLHCTIYFNLSNYDIQHNVHLLTIYFNLSNYDIQLDIHLVTSVGTTFEGIYNMRI